MLYSHSAGIRSGAALYVRFKFRNGPSALVPVVSRSPSFLDGSPLNLNFAFNSIPNPHPLVVRGPSKLRLPDLSRARIGRTNAP